ncbi:uncharacterized protein BDW47DRAFT_21396 [Aspergillus candidus]|uniref:Uncharacterized protein n=1 Tax=Aspergillus candidus TaxID=41067 RepID=A0A2I2FDD7_ASPCN|nr:hypothetical protein BDW47DRAFT_21396 [Aspergillus candidus]PLB38604.1 hypothetical protein BDW47DRAFT_21396 [Aspergillus candidus]
MNHGSIREALACLIQILLYLCILFVYTVCSPKGKCGYTNKYVDTWIESYLCSSSSDNSFSEHRFDPAAERDDRKENQIKEKNKRQSKPDPSIHTLRSKIDKGSKK